MEEKLSEREMNYKGGGNIEAAIILTGEFVLPSMTNQQYSEYAIGYVGTRRVDVENEIPNYFDYVSKYIAKEEKKNQAVRKDTLTKDGEELAEVFHEKSDMLSSSELNHLKEQLDIAQSNDSPLWQMVYSFDYSFLEEQGIYNPETNVVNEAPLMEATRRSMKVLLKKEKLSETTVWTGGFHYDTDNLHIHVAVAEPEPSRELIEWEREVEVNGETKTVASVERKGKIKPTVIQDMLKSFTNTVIDRSLYTKEIAQIIDKNIMNSAKSFFVADNKEIADTFLDVYNRLPDDKRAWNYGMNKIAHLRPQIDNLSKEWLNKYHKDDLEKLHHTFAAQEKYLTKTIGGTSYVYDDYAEKCMKNVYKDIGNSLLGEMKRYDKRVKEIDEKTEKVPPFTEVPGKKDTEKVPPVPAVPGQKETSVVAPSRKKQSLHVAIKNRKMNVQRTVGVKAQKHVALQQSLSSARTAINIKLHKQTMKNEHEYKKLRRAIEVQQREMQTGAEYER